MLKPKYRYRVLLSTMALTACSAATAIGVTRAYASSVAGPAATQVQLTGVSAVLQKLTATGDTINSAQYVVTTNGTAAAALGHNISGAAATTPVLFVEVQGHFVGREAKVPPGQALPEGGYSTLILDSSTLALLGYSIGNGPISLTALGTSESLP